MEGDNTTDVYRECLRNHAASLGSYATDGCGEFTLDVTLPGSLQCAACGCHRNFHRKFTGSRGRAQLGAVTIDYGGGSGSGILVEEESAAGSGKKRFRTKFTAEQKEKMLGFAEKIGWKMAQRRRDEGEDGDEIERFCRGVGVSRQVFKVWMHNHKNNSSSSTSSSSAAAAATATTTNPYASSSLTTFTH